ncbi:hypothetical protein CDL12_04732 [Handroanthus impetiginosus]|uniref:VQ domain-containing protein n=1 Tax=Handroanthus impetiginosus TaxID=429701 RepID=A0A2G9HYF6_9LAMI|nr:hypothetical protein CDL12_04732 [Handroanthus impetiginosus]
MSPSKFHNREVTKGVIHRPQSPLIVSKDTHKIHKSCSPSPSFSSHQQVFENSRATKQPVRRQPQPVIIYTHSPKVIHAKAHDFMALVQKLTGLQRSEDEKTVKSESESTREESSISEEKDCFKNIGYEDTETSSPVLTDEKFLGEIKQESCPISPMFHVSNPYLVDSSFLAPNSNELFYSSRPTSLFQSTSMVNSFSSSYMDIMKGLQDY